MTIGDALWYGVFLAVCFSLYLFVKHGHRLGYHALARRAQELQPEVGDVYLMLPAQESAIYHRWDLPGAGGWFSFVQDMLVTGYLAYFRNNELILEAPWWHRMHLDSTWRPQDLTVHLRSQTDNAYRAPRPMPGLVLGNEKYNRCYVIVGCNMVDPLSVRRTLRVKDGDTVVYARYREQLLEALDQSGFLVAAA